MFLLALRKRFGHHARPLTHLFGSAGFAALLPLVTAPINSRLYEPDAFGLFAQVLAISSVVAIPYVSGFSRTVLLAESEADARGCFASLASALGLPALIMVAVCLASALFGLRAFEITSFSALLTLLTCLSSLTSGFLIFNSSFKAVSIARVAQMVVAASVSIGLGFAGVGILGVLLGHVAGVAASAAIMLRHVPAFRPQLTNGARNLLAAIRTNQKLFTTSLPAEGLNTLTHALPTLLFSVFSGAAFLGLFNMANRLLEMPASLVTSATSQYFQGLAVQRNISGQSLLPLVIGYTTILLAISTPFFIAGVIYAPDLAAWALGEKWRGAGELSRYLSVYILLRIAVSPVTFVVFLRKAFILSLVMDIVLVATVGGGMFVCLKVLKDSTLAVIWFGGVYALSYVFSFWISFIYAQKKYAPAMAAAAA